MYSLMSNLSKRHVVGVCKAGFYPPVFADDSMAQCVHLMIKMSAKITENKYVFNCVNYNDEKIDPFFTFYAGPDDHYHSS